MNTVEDFMEFFCEPEGQLITLMNNAFEVIYEGYYNDIENPLWDDDFKYLEVWCVDNVFGNTQSICINVDTGEEE